MDYEVKKPIIDMYNAAVDCVRYCTNETRATRANGKAEGISETLRELGYWILTDKTGCAYDIEVL